MFEARIADGMLLKKVFDSLVQMVDEVNLDCGESGITMQAMDSSHVSLAMLSLLEPFFERYRCDRPRTLGLKLSMVCKVFKLCNATDAVIIRHVDDSDTVSFVFEGGDEDRLSDFDLKLMNIETDSLGVPDTKFDAVADIPSKHFTRICGDLAQFSDTINVDISSKEIKFACKGQIGGGSTILKPKDSEEEKIQLTVVQDISASFAVRYFNHFAKSGLLSNQVRLALTAESPLEVTYDIQGNSDLGCLKYYLAPKMTEDMDAE